MILALLKTDLIYSDNVTSALNSQARATPRKLGGMTLAGFVPLDLWRLEFNSHLNASEALLKVL
jgi:hypothetical protein